MSALAHEAGATSGRLSLLLATAALHLVLIAGLMTSRLIIPDRGPEAIKSWVDVEPQQPTVRPDPVLTKPSDWSPARTPLPDQPRPEFEQATTMEMPPDIAGPPDAGTAEPPDVGAGAGPTTQLSYFSTRSTDDFYPAAAIRGNEQGSVVLTVCVSASGELAQRPQVITSSGYWRLDGAAIRWVQEAVRFTPATRNGEPVADCKGFRVNFTLRGN